MRCANHPEVQTARRCSSCDRPLCARCLAPSPCVDCKELVAPLPRGDRWKDWAYGLTLLLLSAGLAYAVLGGEGTKPTKPAALGRLLGPPSIDTARERTLMDFFEREGRLLERWRQEHEGAYPKSLEEVKGLGRRPADPYGSGPLSYRRIGGDRALLYSVGPDGRDDGGQGYDPFSGTGDRVYLP